MCPTPFGSGGGAHSLAGGGGGGVPNSDEGTYTVVLYIFMYFVPPPPRIQKGSFSGEWSITVPWRGAGAHEDEEEGHAVEQVEGIEEHPAHAVFMNRSGSVCTLQIAVDF